MDPWIHGSAAGAAARPAAGAAAGAAASAAPACIYYVTREPSCKMHEDASTRKNYQKKTL